MVLDDTNSVMPLLMHENLKVANAFVLCDSLDGERRELYAESCADGGFGTYGKGWLAVKYLV